jgi:hypothetical protein
LKFVYQIVSIFEFFLCKIRKCCFKNGLMTKIPHFDLNIVKYAPVNDKYAPIS